MNANRRTLQYLSGYADNQGLDQAAARHIVSGDETAIPRYRDLVWQMSQNDPKRAHGFVWGILDHLPDADARRSFLGYELPDPRPVGIRRDEWDHRRKMVHYDSDPEIRRTLPYYPDKEDGKGIFLKADDGEEGRKKGGGGDDANGADAPLDLRDDQADPHDDKRGGDGAEQPRHTEEPEQTDPPQQTDEPQATEEPQTKEEEKGSGQEAGKPTPADGWIASKSADALIKEANGGHLSSGPDKGSKECVALVKHAVPGIGQADKWKEGAKIKRPEDPKLAPGTAIATFKDGKYGNNKTGNHAAIIVKPDVVNGKHGYWVLEQNRKDVAQKSFYEFNSNSQKPTSHIENYSVIQKPR